MKSCSQIRREAWQSVVRTKWLWRLVMLTMFLNVIAQIAMSVISDIYTDMGISTWPEFLKSKMAAAQEGLGYTVPSSSAALQMTGASVFETFMAYIFSAIFALGIAVATLKAVQGDEEKWLSGSFEGFRRPLESAWLLFMINFKVMLWSLLLLVPGIVAVYRYRQAWYLKARNPEWPAAKCIAESGTMMSGYKWKSFLLDLSYIGWLLLAGASVGGALLMQNTFALGLAMVAAVFVVCYLFAARAVLFREIIAEKGCSAQGDE